MLDLHPGAHPCLRCGYCCRKATCGFGESTHGQEEGRCAHLKGDEPGKYECAIAQEIMAQPRTRWFLSPAFGAGCCSPLNSDRQALAEQTKKT